MTSAISTMSSFVQKRAISKTTTKLRFLWRVVINCRNDDLMMMTTTVVAQTYG